MKKRGTILGCRWAGERICTANAKHSIFTTPLLLAESKCKYKVSQFWLFKRSPGLLIAKKQISQETECRTTHFYATAGKCSFRGNKMQGKQCSKPFEEVNKQSAGNGMMCAATHVLDNKLRKKRRATN